MVKNYTTALTLHYKIKFYAINNNFVLLNTVVLLFRPLWTQVLPLLQASRSSHLSLKMASLGWDPLSGMQRHFLL